MCPLIFSSDEEKQILFNIKVTFSKSKKLVQYPACGLGRYGVTQSVKEKAIL